MGSRELQVMEVRWGGVGDKGLLDLLCTSNLIAAKALEVTMLSAMGMKAGFGGGGGFTGRRIADFSFVPVRCSCPRFCSRIVKADSVYQPGSLAPTAAGPMKSIDTHSLAKWFPPHSQ